MSTRTRDFNAEPRVPRATCVPSSLLAVAAFATLLNCSPRPVHDQPSPVQATPSEPSLAEFETRLDPKQWGICEPLPDLSFVDLDGKPGRLSDYADRAALVVVVRDVGCPVGKRYGLRTAELERKFAARGVAFLYVNVSRQDSVEECRAEAKGYGFTGRYARDGSGRFGWFLHISSTTDVFVVDKLRRLVFRGPVDDQIVRGVTKVAPTRLYLSDALDQLLSGKPIEPSALSAPGCHLDFNDEPPADPAARAKAGK